MSTAPPPPSNTEILQIDEIERQLLLNSRPEFHDALKALATYARQIITELMVEIIDEEIPALVENFEMQMEICTSEAEKESDPVKRAQILQLLDDIVEQVDLLRVPQQNIIIRNINPPVSDFRTSL